MSGDGFWAHVRLFLGLIRETGQPVPPSFGEFTPAMRQDLHNARIVTFLVARADELYLIDPDGATKCRQAIDDCCDRIDGTGIDRKPVHLRGAINDMRSLRRLARNWSDHPDFHPEWETP